jgi:hypothetical protein
MRCSNGYMVQCASSLCDNTFAHTSRRFLGRIYQTITWRVRWMLDRIYFSDDDSLLLAARTCVIAGICYVPIRLVETFAGP